MHPVFQVPLELSGHRLDKAAAVLTGLARSWIEKNLHLLLVNDRKAANISQKVKTGDQIQLLAEPAPPPSINKTYPGIEIKIVYEDDSILVIDKPAGISVYPAHEQQQDNYTLVDFLRRHCGDKLSTLGGDFRAGIVHRLDKDTSGLTVVAKTDEAHANLSEQLRARQMKRHYQALVWGMLLPTEGTITSNLARDEHNRLKMRISTAGKNAVTHYQVIQVLGNGKFSLVACQLDTGRTHQIRVHLSHIGHSIVGDQTYGKNAKKLLQLEPELQREVEKLKRQALHACYLSFFHPETNLQLEFKSNLAQEILKLIEALS